ncbi:MAG TPA: NADH-quinone oxidoreductase subunit A [Gammaproteobacteria bacterium]|nr:NADH-quinone oxidoreductase subunit A [Gammaproteobacteria bacterium]
MSDEALAALAVYFGAVLALVAVVLGASAALGERHRDLATGEPFESGIVPVQPARIRLRAKFYIVAMLFVIFDVEAVYVITWALVAREGGWPAYIEVVVFVGLLLAALAYLWRLGALEWGTGSQRAAADLARDRAARRETAASSAGAAGARAAALERAAGEPG